MALLLCLVMLLSIFLTSCDSGSSTPSDTSSSQTESTVVGNNSTNTESSGSSSNSEAASSNAGSSNVATEPAYHITKDNKITLKMTVIASIPPYTDSNGVYCKIVQGSFTDGKYVYVTLNDGNSEDPNSISAIRKFDAETGELIKTYENFSFCHCNDMTYNPKTGEFVVVHNAPNRRWISIFDLETMTLKKKLKLDLKIYSMSYDPYENCYWVGISGGYTFAKLDLDFKQIGEIYTGFESGFTKQGMDIDSKYIYFLQWKKNCIQVYDKSGNYIRQIDLPIGFYEPENICHIGDVFYIGYYTTSPAGGRIYKTQFIAE